MKFQVREGFAVKRLVRVELGEGNFELHESSTHAGQMIDLDAAEAAQHGHQLELRDADATAWMRTQELKIAAPGGPFGLTAAQLETITLQVLMAQRTASASNAS